MNIVLKVKRALKLTDLKIHTKTIEPILQSKEVNPTVEQQNITCDSGYNGLSNVVVNGVNSSIDSNIQSGNIKDGVSILGVTGNYKLDVYQYFYETAPANYSTWSDLIKAIPRFEMEASSLTSKFAYGTYEYIDVSGVNTANATEFRYCFYNCKKLKEIDVSMWTISNFSRINSMFDGCTSLQKCDVRNIEFSQIQSSFKRDVFVNVPSNCLIIVKNDTEKNKVMTDYGMTNVKTVDEYENQ